MPRHSQFQQNYANYKTNKVTTTKKSQPEVRILHVEFALQIPRQFFVIIKKQHLKTKDACGDAAAPSPGTVWKIKFASTPVDLLEKFPILRIVMCCLTHGCFYLERKYRKALPTWNRGRITAPQKSKVSQQQVWKKEILSCRASKPTNIKQQQKWISEVHSKFHTPYSPLKGK